MIHIVRWNPLSKVAEDLALDALPTNASDLPEGSVVWIDLDDPTPEEEARVLKEFLPVHILTLEDTLKPRVSGQSHLPKVEEFPDYLFVIVNPLPQELHDAVESKKPTTRIHNTGFRCAR